MEPNKVNTLISECKELLNEQSEPFQKKMKAKHSRLKNRVIGHGGQGNTPPFTQKPSMKRSKSAPPIGEDLQLDEAFDKLKRYLTGLGAATAIAAGSGIGAKTMGSDVPTAQAQAQIQQQKPHEQVQNEKFTTIKNGYIRDLKLRSLTYGGIPDITQKGGTDKTRALLNTISDNMTKTFELKDKRLAIGLLRIAFFKEPHLSNRIKGETDEQAQARWSKELRTSWLVSFDDMNNFAGFPQGIANIQTFLNICTLIKMSNPDMQESEIFKKAQQLYGQTAIDAESITEVQLMKKQLGVTLNMSVQDVGVRENKKTIIVKRIDRNII